MKITWFKVFIFFFTFYFGVCSGQTIEHTPSLQINLKEVGGLYISQEKPTPLSLDALKEYQLVDDARSFFYLDFDARQAYINFEVSNPYKEDQDMVLVFSYPFVENVKLFQVDQNKLELLGRAGIFSGERTDTRSWTVPFTLEPKKSSTYFLVIEKGPGKPVATDITLFSKEKYNRVSMLQNSLIGFYFGITALSILFALFIFGLTRYSVFLLYGFYLVALGIYLGAYFGFTNIFLSPSKLNDGRTIYVIAIESSLLIFVLFAQQLLQAKKYLPKLKIAVEVVIILALLIFRGVTHFIGGSIEGSQFAYIQKAWYLTILFLIFAVLIQVIVYIRHNPRIGSLFALSYLFMIFGAVFMVLHQSIGLLKITFFGLSHILFAATIEIILLSITIAFIVGKIYKDRNMLSNTLLVQQQKFLNAFVQGQEEERKRLGSELHDNVGSRVSGLKRLFRAKHQDEVLEKEFDVICNEIRNMAHAITPAEIAMVGLPATLEDFLEEVEGAQGLKINFNTFQFPEKIDETIGTHLFRIVQELIQNVMKHANANLVNVQLFGHENSITLSFEDNGGGIDEKQKSKGFGLRSIKSRVAQMNGQFLLDADKGKGTSVLVIIPT